VTYSGQQVAAAKENLRLVLAGIAIMSREEGNRAAEQLRRLPAYREAGLLFVSPAPALLQLRINALLDGKELLMPGPGLREGFYLLKPYSLPFQDLTRAVTMKELARHGTRLDRQALGNLAIDMMLTDAVAVDEAGGRLGRGHGFFDLCCAIFYEFKAAAATCRLVGVVSETQILSEELPRDPWDARLDLLVTPTGSREIKGMGQPPPALIWEALPERKIRKMTPLWQLFQARREKFEA
jgi:5-formyltetrahydrofolate cyclo-ligase